jgi:hypothetical protein
VIPQSIEYYRDQVRSPDNGDADDDDDEEEEDVHSYDDDLNVYRNALSEKTVAAPCAGRILRRFDGTNRLSASWRPYPSLVSFWKMDAGLP